MKEEPSEAAWLVRLRDLGKKFDHQRTPPLVPFALWAPGDEPHWESIDLAEYVRQVRGLKLCRSFRADLRHKLQIILRAHGGYGNGGLDKTAAVLGTTRWAVRAWLRWDRTPRYRNVWEKIDARYQDAVEKLVALELARKKKQNASETSKAIRTGRGRVDGY